MGYSTDLIGCFDLDKPLKPEHKAYLEAFAKTRRMRRNAARTALLNDKIRAAVNLPVGAEGGYYVGSKADFGQEHSPDVVDYNGPPEGQPGLWCQWVPTEDGDRIHWDGGEKFNYYVEWLEYLIAHFLKPWGYVLNGKMGWQGEDSSDRGTIWVKNNVVKTVESKVIDDEPEWEDETKDDKSEVEPDPAPNPIESILDIIDGDEK